MSSEQHPFIVAARLRMEIREGRASAWQVLAGIASGHISVQSWWRCRKHRARQLALQAASPVVQAQARVARLEAARARFASTGAVDLVLVVEDRLREAKRDLAALEDRS